MKVEDNLMLIFGIIETLLLNSITYSYGVQTIHSKVRLNPLSLATKIQKISFMFHNSKYTQLLLVLIIGAHTLWEKYFANLDKESCKDLR